MLIIFRRLFELANFLNPSIISDTFFENVYFNDGSSFNKFINELPLDEDSRDAVSQVVKDLYEHFQHYLPFSINKFVKVRVTALRMLI